MSNEMTELEQQLRQAERGDLGWGGPFHSMQYGEWADMAAELGRKLGQALDLLAKERLPMTQVEQDIKEQAEKLRDLVDKFLDALTSIAEVAQAAEGLKLITCPTCNGSGKESRPVEQGGWYACSDCGGSGQVYTDEEQWYIRGEEPQVARAAEGPEEAGIDERNLHWSARHRLMELLCEDCKGLEGHPIQVCLSAMRRAYAAQLERVRTIKAEAEQTAEGKPVGEWVCPECGCEDWRWDSETNEDWNLLLYCQHCGARMEWMHLVDLEEVLAVIEAEADWDSLGGGVYAGIKDKLRARFGGGE